MLSAYQKATFSASAYGGAIGDIPFVSGISVCFASVKVAAVVFLPVLHPAKALAAAKTYYVKAGAATSNNGLSPATPFPTIQQATDLTNPGDTVSIMDGTYTEGSRGAVIYITRSGTPAAYITYTAYPGQHPLLHATTAWNHILVKASYITIEGLTVQGNAANLTLADALAHKDNADPRYNTNGDTIRDNDTNRTSIHIVIRNNLVYDCPGGGIMKPCTDNGGGQDVGYNDNGDSLGYHNVNLGSG